MSGRYEVEDLLKLRASPLVAKPAKLPPIEEWMGPVDPNPRRPALRTKADDTTSTTDSAQKKANFIEAQSRRSTTDPERIHLGPPRRSFASSNARKFGTSDGEEGPAKDRVGVHHERTKTSDSVEQRYGDRSSGSYAVPNGKHAGRHDTEAYSQRRDDEDFENRPKRDSAKWGPKENTRDSEPRDVPNRGRFDQPWIRKPKGGESIDEGRRDGQTWRRAGVEKDVGLTERHEAEPEWADAIQGPESAKAHTHEDFLLWMESMKNKTSGENKSNAELVPNAPDQESETKRATAMSSAALISPDTSVDKFFAKFEEKKTSADASTTGKPAKSRFASIFNTKADAKSDQTSTETPTIPSPTQTSLSHIQSQQTSGGDPEKKANDEAFAKLLAMLNKNQGNNSQQSNQPPKARSPLTAPGPEHSRSQLQSPDLTSFFVQTSSAQQPAPSYTPTQSLDQVLESRSPAEQPQRATPKATTDDLLSLLRRNNLNENHQKPQPLQHHEQRLPPGLFPSPHDMHDRQPPMFEDGRREPARSPFDDFALSGMHYREDMERQQGSQRRPAPNAPNTNFGDMNNDMFRQNTEQQARPIISPDERLPPGLQRPPGLDNMPRMPPGWPNQPPPPHQHSQHRQGPPPPPPPGINPSRGIPPFAGPPPQQPLKLSNPQQQYMPSTKQGSEPSGPMGFANGMPPPPGFGPPHSFTSPPGLSNMGGRYAMGGGMGLADRERIERQGIYTDMYGAGGGNRGGSGGIGMPPGFR